MDKCLDYVGSFRPLPHIRVQASNQTSPSRSSIDRVPPATIAARCLAPSWRLAGAPVPKWRRESSSQRPHRSHSSRNRLVMNGAPGGGGGRGAPRIPDGQAPESADFANYFCTYAFIYHQVLTAAGSAEVHCGLAIQLCMRHGTVTVLPHTGRRKTCWRTPSGMEPTIMRCGKTGRSSKTR